MKVYRSMGPRSENRGYALPVTASGSVAAVASMGPRSENRGYAMSACRRCHVENQLQWVHGPRTVVMALRRA